MQNPEPIDDVVTPVWWHGQNGACSVTNFGFYRAQEDLSPETLMAYAPLDFIGYRLDKAGDVLSIEFARRID